MRNLRLTPQQQMTESAVRQQVTPAWRLPFTSQPWRDSGYVVLAIPAAVTALRDGGRWQQQLARQLLHRLVPRTRWRGVLALPLHLVALVLIGYGWSIVLLNLGYPVRWAIGMGGSLSDSWGGPTMAGAWTFHALLGGLPFLFAMPWLVRAISALQARMLGP